MQRRAQLVLSVSCLAMVALSIVVFSRVARIRRSRADILIKLRSDDLQDRKQAAWRTVKRRDPAAIAILTKAVTGDEPDDNVREAYVYALGKIGDPRHFAAVESAINSDSSGYVRAAAWLAAARIDPDHFQNLAENRDATADVWDRLGLAQGGLFLGDARGVDDLLHLATAGNDAQRQVASRALYKWIRPLLETAGRWPLKADVEEGQTWSPEFVRDIEQRCAPLDLQAISDRARRNRRETYRVRRYVDRITRARNHLADFLFEQ